MFETHSDKGKERWEVFAWAIRDVMCTHGEFLKCNVSMRKKCEYEKYMQMQPNAIHPEDIVIDPENLHDSSPEGSPELGRKYSS